MLDEVLNDIPMPDSLESITENIPMPSMPLLDGSAEVKPKGDIFSLSSRKSWDKSVEARCDFRYVPRLTHRASVSFITIWQKSIVGKTLTEIKADDAMIPFFVTEMVKMIRECLGSSLHLGSWAVVTTPMRRHKERNFASLIAEGIARELGTAFYYDCAHCSSRHRVGAVFSPNNIPSESNIIVFDDFVTTGSTLKAMKDLLLHYDKNMVFFAGINNKL